MNKKILIIDDDERIISLYKMVLEGQGYEVGVASDGKSGLEEVAKQKPDLILVDAMMPGVSGFDTLTAIKAMPDSGSTKVIMLTALSDENIKQRAISAGADDYIVKSQLTVPEVSERIKKLFA